MPSGSIPPHSADLALLRISPCNDGNCNQAAIGRDLIPQFFTRSKSADTTIAQEEPIIIAREEPIMRTMSSSHILGKNSVFEWDDPYGMKTTTAVSNKRSIIGLVGRLKAFNNLKLSEGAKLDHGNANPYIKVVCGFSDGENEVLFPPLINICFVLLSMAAAILCIQTLT